MIKSLYPHRDPAWMEKALGSLRHLGIAVIEDILDPEACEAGIAAINHTRDCIAKELTEESLRSLRLKGVNELRLVLQYDPFFLELLQHPILLATIDATLGDKAVLRFQNAEILGGDSRDLPPLVQNSYHMNTQRVTPGSLLSLDAAFLMTPFQFAVSPGTHQQAAAPSLSYLQWSEYVIDAPAGALLVFDSTLWHREITDPSDAMRYIVEHQFTKSYIKPHFDYPRVLGEEKMLSLPERTRQLLGWHTRLPASLAEFYLPADQRLYRSDQG